MSDAYLSLPLEGVQAIEASAGTGKTFTLTTLVMRLLVERNLAIGEILAVTFTEAATQELRARVRKRLLLALRVVDGDAEDASPEAALTRTLIETHLADSGESRSALRRRLRKAIDGIDLAAIFTIHGFCARVLREHALESGQGFDAPEQLPNDATLREAIAADLWRANALGDDSVADLLALWPEGPEALARDLSPLVREKVLVPVPGPAASDPEPEVQAASTALAAAVRQHGDDFHEALLSAHGSGVFKLNIYKIEWIEDLFNALKSWAGREDHGASFEHEKLEKLTRQALVAGTKKDFLKLAPVSPLSHVVEDYLDVLTKAEAHRELRRTALLHRLRDDARLRMARLKRQLQVRTYDDLIDQVADALDGANAGALVAALRGQYRVALVDEFQDTDPRQWHIFGRVFGNDSGAPALFVIGDPKQAIYGFRGGDVDTYLAAKKLAREAPALSQNFRSRPSVLGAVDALYAQAGDEAFVDTRIRFRNVESGGTRDDADYQRDGTTAPALTLWQATPPEPGEDGKAKSYSAGQSRELATTACVAAIHAVLTEARAGKATLAGKPVQPGDIAVLVRTHHEATRMREALAAVGIPAVAAGKQSLFATNEARELHALLLALLHGADDGRLRTALSTVLVGEPASRIAALERDGDALRRWQLAALGWRERLQRGGPLALVGDLCAMHAPRLLGLRDGERRLSNYLQLAELLQEAQQLALGLHGLVDWLAQAIAAASADDEAQLLRLESDARRVQIVTLHKSKGLEYPLVFLPYAGIGGKARNPGRHVTVPGDNGRTLHWKLQVADSGWTEASEQWKRAQLAEDARLLYVGLTRARDALWLASGPFYNHRQSPQWAMVADAQALVERAEGAVVIDDAVPADTLPWLPPEQNADSPQARTPTRALDHDWWVYSFTQLANADAGHDPSSAATQPAPGGRDEPGSEDDEAVVDVADPRFGGTRFGVVLHDVLEHADFGAWQGWQPGDDAPDGEHAKIADALGRGGYAAADIDDGIAVLVQMAGHTLTVALPEGTTLAVLPQAQRRAEIEFQFALAPTRVDDLLALLHGHGLLRDRHGFGVRRRLEGLMTGLIDLTYQHDGRWFVLDYKSNRLPGYGAAQLDAAMAHSEYDLQALIYTLALHRWLRFRLGEGYDYARDFGGVRYLFCRGLDAARVDSPGVQAWAFEPALVDALDALFAGQPQGAAA